MSQTNHCDCPCNYEPASTVKLPIRNIGFPCNGPTIEVDMSEMGTVLGAELEKLIKRVEELEKNQCHCGGDGTPDKAAITLIGGTAEDIFRGLAATDDGYIACGYTSSAGAGSKDGLLVKFGKDLGVISTAVVGGTGADTFYNIIPTSNGGCLAMGGYASTGTSGLSDAWLIALDKDMGIIGSNLLGISGWNECFLGADSTPAGFTGTVSYVAVGSATAGFVSNGIIATYDKDFNVLKSSRIGSTTSGFSELQSVIATQDGFVAVGRSDARGTAGQDGLLIKFDSNLNVQKRVLIGGAKEELFRSIAKIPTGYVVGGLTASVGKGDYDMLLLTLDDEFKIVNKATIGGTGSEQSYDIVALSDGNFATVGYTTSAGAGTYDAILMVLDPNLNILKQLVFGGSGIEGCCAVVANSDGSFTVVGNIGSVGAGGSSDAFIGTFKGDFTKLTGNLTKYPALRVDANPGFVAQHSFTLEESPSSVLVTSATFTVKSNPPYTVTTSPANLIVDAGAVI